MSAFGPYDHSGGYSPLAGGIPYQQWAPYGGMPGGVLGQLGAQMLIDPQMAALGLTPMGMADVQNMADRVRRMQLTRNYDKVVRGSVGGDNNTIKLITDNVQKAIAGGNLSEAEKNNAQQIQTTIDKMGTAALPVISAMFPEQLDKLMGSRGSSTVQAGQVALAGRYRIDPITGKMGMSAESSIRTADNLFNSPQEINSMKGFRAGETGQIYEEMTRRGMMPGGGDMRSNLAAAMERMKVHSGKDDFAGDAYKAAGISPGKAVSQMSDKEISSLTSQSEVQSAMRDVDTGKIKGQLKKYAGALAAMKEIFEDNGRSGASVTELFNGLEQMTNGSMSKLDPGRVEMIVRNMSNLAQSSGVGLQGAMAMQANASQTAQAMGLDPIFGVQAVMGGLGYIQGHNATGGSANPMWGQSNSTQLGMKDTNLRLSAANSQMANQMGLAAKLADTGITFNNNSQAAAYVDAVKKGLPIDGMNMNEREFIDMIVKDSGGTLSSEQVSLMLQNKDANQEFVSKYNVPDNVRRQQGKEDVFPFVGEEMSFNILGSTGIVDKDDSIRAGLQKTLGDAVGSMDKETRSNAGLRNTTLGKALKDKLQNNPQILERTKNMTPEQEKQFWEGLAQGSFDAADAGVRSEFGGSIADQLALHDDKTLDRGAEAQYEATGRSIIQSSLSGIGTGNWVSKLSDVLQKSDFSKDPDALMKIIGATVGGIDSEEVKKHLGGAMSNITTAQKAIRDTKEKYAKSAGDARWQGDKEKEKKLKAQYDEELSRQEAGLETAKGELTSYLDTNEEARAALEAARKKDAEKNKDGEAKAAEGDPAAPGSKDVAITGELRIIGEDGNVRRAQVTAQGVPKDGTHTGVA